MITKLAIDLETKINRDLINLDFSYLEAKKQKIFKDLLKAINKKKYKLSMHELFYLSRADKKLWPEYLIFRSDFLKLASEKPTLDFPLYILIEPVSICNLRCVMCFQTDKSFSGNKDYMGRMDLSLFKNLIDQAENGGAKAITLASRGDPTMHKQLPEMLEYMKGKFLETKLNTNGALLTSDLSRCILDSEITDLVFSIDSYEKDNYEEIRKKGKFDKVICNIKDFVDIRDREFQDHRTTVRVSGVKIDHKQVDKKYHEFWSDLVDYSMLSDVQMRWDTYNNNKLHHSKLLPCGDLWERMYIWWDGKVNPCDVDYKSTLSVGDTNNNSIKDIWNNKQYTDLREAHLSGNRKNYSVCSRCDAWIKAPSDLISHVQK